MSWTIPISIVESLAGIGLITLAISRRWIRWLGTRGARTDWLLTTLYVILGSLALIWALTTREGRISLLIQAIVWILVAGLVILFRRKREDRPVTKQDRVFQDAQALILFGGIFLMLNGAARLLELLF